MVDQLFLFDSAVTHEPAVDMWLAELNPAVAAIAGRWFEEIRQCGPDVRELLHDDHPTACVEQAAFAYVNAFKAHVNVGFYRGAELEDPHGLLQGTGKYMRHVKVIPQEALDEHALASLIQHAYKDMQARLSR